MINPLINNLYFSEYWLSSNSIIDSFLLFICLAFVCRSAFHSLQRFARPAFIMAVFTIILYQIPLVLFSPLFYNHLPSAKWFAISIHFAVIANLAWVYFTPKLNNLSATNNNNIQKEYAEKYFVGLAFWLPTSIFFILLGLYFYKIPFSCTALFALFTDQDITLLVREIIGKLMGRTYAPHVLNTLTSGVGPIIAFLCIGRIYFDCKKQKYFLLPLWTLLLSIVMITPLLGGAKGSLVPMAIALSVSGFLVAKNWKLKIIIVSGIIAVFVCTITLVKVTQESSVGKGNYNFGSCITILGVCERTKPLLESLRPPKAYYGLTRERLDDLGDEMVESCKISKIKSEPLIENIESKSNKPAIPSLETHIVAMFYRIFGNPIQVASWHYLFVDEHGSPSFNGLAIAKIFSENYVSVPAQVCDIYYTGDKTSACTAPTSYIFTYPAYLGLIGLLIACFLTIIFDVIASLFIKYSAKPFADLTIGLTTVAIVNFIVADYTTVIISHGAGVAIIILIMMRACVNLSGKSKL